MTNLSNLLVNDLRAVLANNPKAKKLKKADVIDVVTATFEALGFKEMSSVNDKVVHFVAKKPEIGGIHIFIRSHRESYTGEAFASIAHETERKEIHNLEEFLLELSKMMDAVSRAVRTYSEVKKQAPDYGISEAKLVSYELDRIVFLLDGQEVEFEVGSEYSVMNTLHEHMEDMERENECTYCGGGVCINCSPEQFLDADQLEEINAPVNHEQLMYEAVNEKFPHADFEGIGEGEGEYTYFFKSTLLKKADLVICIYGNQAKKSYSCSIELEREDEEIKILKELDAETPEQVVEFIQKESKRAYKLKKKSA